MKQGSGLRRMMSLAMVVSALASIGGTTAQPGSNSMNRAKRTEATLPDKLPTRPVSVKNNFGGFSGEGSLKHNWGTLNQRQYRKLMRQNPSLRKSKKARRNN